MKVTDQSMTGVQGIAMIASAVGRMGHLWRETPGAADVGIDGDIELKDPGTGQVRNFRIGVQSKATTLRWAGEDEERFHFTPTKRHIDYWLSSNQPVLLVCSRPETGEIYWRSVQEWAANPAARATRRVNFDKRRDVFDESARDRLFDLRASAEDRAEPPTPASLPETVTTNLLPVLWRSKRLHSATVPHSDAARLFGPARDQRVHDFAAVLRDGMVWSLEPYDDEFLRAIGATAPRTGPLEPWLRSDAATDLNLVRDLVRRSVLSSHHRQLQWHNQKRLAYFRRRRGADWEPVIYAWSKGRGRTVVAPQRAKTREGHTGYRHDAAELLVRRLSGRWHVQVKPTYLFTWDGHRVSGHHASSLAGIKRLETHPAVSQALRMWEHLLAERLTIDAAPSGPFSLGRLVTASSPASITDNAWRRLTPEDLGRGEDAGAWTLFDEDGSAA